MLNCVLSTNQQFYLNASPPTQDIIEEVNFILTMDPTWHVTCALHLSAGVSVSDETILTQLLDAVPRDLLYHDAVAAIAALAFGSASRVLRLSKPSDGAQQQSCVAWSFAMDANVRADYAGLELTSEGVGARYVAMLGPPHGEGPASGMLSVCISQASDDLQTMTPTCAFRIRTESLTSVRTALDDWRWAIPALFK